MTSANASAASEFAALQQKSCGIAKVDMIKNPLYQSSDDSIVAIATTTHTPIIRRRAHTAAAPAATHDKYDTRLGEGGGIQRINPHYEDSTGASASSIAGAIASDKSTDEALHDEFPAPACCMSIAAPEIYIGDTCCSSTNAGPGSPWRSVGSGANVSLKTSSSRGGSGNIAYAPCVGAARIHGDDTSTGPAYRAINDTVEEEASCHQHHQSMSAPHIGNCVAPPLRRTTTDALPPPPLARKPLPVELLSTMRIHCMGRGANPLSRTASSVGEGSGSEGATLVPSILATHHRPRWLHSVATGVGPLSRSAAEKLLAAGGAVGEDKIPIRQPTWLVRSKGQLDSYVISVQSRCSREVDASGLEYRHYQVERSVRADGTKGSHFVVNASVRLHMCVTIEDVVKVLAVCAVTSQRIWGRSSPLLVGLPTLHH
jgi:hypothetical protein